ncbi:MAG TPA: mechanosensitive ion channel domain-containing protein [Burkholderiales bacterium]|nr:mechanosensitive ion channel domain-containing protein [Burkholderiales bacterium]
MTESSEAHVRNLILEVWEDLQRPGVLWQLAALVTCLVVAWVLARTARRRAPEAAAKRWQFGAESLKRVLFPTFAFVLLLGARAALQPFMKVTLLDLAIPLAGSAALITLLLYTLRYVFAPSGVLAAFERTIATVVWGGVALYLAGALPDLLRWLDAVSLPVGRQRISMLLVLQALSWATVTVLAALWAASAIETRLMRAESVDANLRVAFSRLMKAALVLVAIVVVLPMVGIDLTVLSVFGGALGVGLGFGLQKIASNYVSGFIVLLERSIRLGDLITADQFYGEVKDITTRYVIVRAPDGREAIIPNELLITSKVLNHSYTDGKIRHALQIQVEYGCDVEEAVRLMQGAASHHPQVSKKPSPKALLTRFGESGVELELGYWVGDRQPGTDDVKSEVGLEVLRSFRKAGIAVPYPHREVRLLRDRGKVPPAPNVP